MSLSGGVVVEKNNLEELLERSLTIPEYQRRYCWGKKQVEQLLDDVKGLLDSNSQPPLFLGTVILHQYDDKANLVDGQQRCLTLILLLKALHQSLETQSTAPAIISLMAAKFPDSQSQQSLVANYQQITAYLKTACISAEKLQTLLAKLEFVVIIITDIDQAFSFFDSQNSSGKRLTDFDLLKARHLRGVVSDPSVGIGCSYIWEQYENQKVGNGQRLAYYLTEQILARTRMRQRNKPVDSLRLEQEFAVYTGNINNATATSIQLSPPTAVGFYRNWQVSYQADTAGKLRFLFSTELSALNTSSLVFKVEDVTQLPLQLNQPLLGGEQFFFYIAKYTELYLRYFPLDVTDENKKIVSEPSSIEPPLHQRFLQLHRVLEQGQSAGYSRLIEIWLALVVFYLDRFGKNQDFNEFVCVADQYVFSLRITADTLRRDGVEKHFQQKNLFDTLLQCPSSLQALELIKYRCDMQAAEIVKDRSKGLSEILEKKTGVIWRYLQVFYLEIKHHECHATSLSTVMCEVIKANDGEKNV